MGAACASTSSIPTPDVGAPQSEPARLRVGRLTKAHGLKGALKIEMYTDAPERRFVPGAVFSLQVPDDSPWHGRELELVELRNYNGQPVGFFVGVDDRTAAEGLAKAILWVDEDPEGDREDNAWYERELVGLRVRRGDEVLGTVARLEHMPAQDLLVVRVEDRDVLVPFVEAIVPTVDIAAGEIIVTPPAGLFEELDAPAPVSDETVTDEPDAENA